MKRPLRPRNDTVCRYLRGPAPEQDPDRASRKGTALSSDKLVDRVASSMLPGLGPLPQARALDRFGDPGEVAWRVPTDALADLPRCQRRVARDVRETRRTLWARAEREVVLPEFLRTVRQHHEAFLEGRDAKGLLEASRHEK